jgi:hypothetical protein
LAGVCGWSFRGRREAAVSCHGWRCGGEIRDGRGDSQQNRGAGVRQLRAAFAGLGEAACGRSCGGCGRCRRVGFAAASGRVGTRRTVGRAGAGRSGARLAAWARGGRQAVRERVGAGRTAGHAGLSACGSG